MNDSYGNDKEDTEMCPEAFWMRAERAGPHSAFADGLFGKVKGNGVPFLLSKSQMGWVQIPNWHLWVKAASSCWKFQAAKS